MKNQKVTDATQNEELQRFENLWQGFVVWSKWAIAIVVAILIFLAIAFV